MKGKVIQPKHIFGILLVYSILIIIVSVGIYLFLDNLSDALAFGQLFLTILLLPTVIIGFIITVEEFRKAQAIPDLDLYWEIRPGKFEKEIEFEIPENGSIKKGIRPVLINNGNAVAIWYLVNIDIPLEYLYHQELELNKQNKLQLGPAEKYIADSWTHHVGRIENWRYDFIKLKKMRMFFISNGQLASYPDYPQPLGILTFTLVGGRDYPQVCEVSYSIAADKSQPKYGSLGIKFLKN